MKKLLRYSTLVMVLLLGAIALFTGKQIKNEQLQAEFNADKLQQMFKAKSKKLTKNKKQVLMGYPDEFAKLHRDLRTRSGDAAPAYPVNYKFTEFNKAKTQLQKFKGSKSRILKNYEFEERGPANVGGRTRAIVVDPRDETSNTWFAGAVGGGVWKTTNAGESWTNLTPNIPNLAVASMAMAPSNPDVLYAGTGEGFYNVDAIRGDGLITSFDGGVNWQQVTGTASFGCVNRIVIDPQNERALMVAISENTKEFGAYGQIKKTIDGGDSWTTVYDDPNGWRVQDLKYHPTDYSVQYASVNSYGVIKSTDAGESWELVLDLAQFNRSELAIAPSDPQVVYAAVEGNGQSLLYKTVDGGQNWENVGDGSLTNWLGAQGWYDNAIGINPYDADDVYLGGIYLWRLTESNEGISDVQENGTETFMQLVPWGGFQGSGVGTGAEFSTFVGLPEPFNVTNSDYTSVQIKFGPGLGQKAHSFSYDGQASYYEEYVDVPFEIWDTENNVQLTASFLDLNQNGAFDLIPINDEVTEIIWVNAIEYNAEGPNSNVTGYSGVGFLYKNTYTVMPALANGASWNPDDLPESNLAIIYSTNGQAIASLDMVSGGYSPGVGGTHVDHHNLTLIPMNDDSQEFRIINGNDGGIFYSDNEGDSWTDCLNGYLTTQFYGADKRPDADEYIGGMQDNGTWQSVEGQQAGAESDYHFRLGGDGYETSWHYTNPDWLIGGSQFNGIQRSVDGGESWEYVGGQIDNGSGNAPFVTKIAKSNSDPDLLFAVGAQGVWRSEDFGAHWNLLPIPENEWRMTSLTQVEISYANPQVVWAGAWFGSSTYPDATIHVSTDGGASFTPVGGVPEQNMGYITGLATHPTDKNTAYALFSFADAPKILRTTDLGENWEDISGFGNNAESDNGFPDVATYSLVQMPHDPNIIWAGTEIGLFESTDNGESWHYAIAEFPAVSIWQMTITNDQIVLATHGRGIMTVTVPELPDNPPAVTLAPRIEFAGIVIDEGAIQMEAKLRSAYDSTHFLVNNERYVTIPANSQAVSEYINYPVNEQAEVEFQLKSYKDGEVYYSSVFIEELVPLNTVSNNYFSDFDTGNDDFMGSGFLVYKPVGFDSKGLHSFHPYNDAATETFMLLTPIVVGDDYSLISFNEIAIIEPGESGVSYPSNSFYDYVVMQGSTDGKNWIDLSDGYDATAYSNWLSAYNSGINVDESYYQKRVLDLQDVFDEGETVLLRFKLYADQSVTGWGWAIDSLNIQNPNVGIQEMSSGGVKFIENYPNPFNEKTNISYSLSNKAAVSIEIYSMEGRLLQRLVNEEQLAGNYTAVWEPVGIKPGTYYCRFKAGEFIQTRKLIKY